MSVYTWVIRTYYHGRFFLMKQLGFFPSYDEKNLRPVIMLVMEFGVQPPTPPSLTLSTLVKTKERAKSSGADERTRFAQARSVTTPPTRKRERSLDVSDRTPSKVVVLEMGQHDYTPPAVHPQYDIFAYGCSNTVYKVIKPDEKKLYVFLFATWDRLIEHPR